MSSNDPSSQAKLEHIRQLLDAGRPDQALQFIEKNGSQSREIKNALGVCLMRLGQTEKAVNVLRELVFGQYMCIPSDTPPLFQANYATAMMLRNNNQVAIDLIRALSVSAHPYIARLRQNVKQWQRTLPIHQRLACILRLYPRKPVLMDFPPGRV